VDALVVNGIDSASFTPMSGEYVYSLGVALVALIVLVILIVWLSAAWMAFEKSLELLR